ncbi:MAG: tetratricopeptide repeat protein [Chitinophagaceae bacterium]
MSKLIFCLCFSFFFLTFAQAQPGNIEIRKVMDLFQNQQFDEAIFYLTPLEKKDPNNIEVLGYLGYGYYMADDYKASGKIYERILGIDSNNIQALRYLADITASKAPDSSMIFSRRLIGLQPGKAVYYRNLGELLRRAKDRDSALVYFQQAYTLLPTDPKNGVALAEMLIFKKRYATADSIIRLGLAQDSLHIPFLKLAVKSAYQSENFLGAIAPGERLIRMEEPSSITHTELALSYFNLKMYDNSYRVCQFLIESGFNTEDVYYYQSKAAGKMKQYAKSNELLQNCLTIAISPTAEKYFYDRGQNYEAVRDYKKAIKQYDSAYYLFKDPFMMYYIASIYETHLKDQNQARKYYTKFLALAKPRNQNEMKAVQYVRERWGGGAVNDSVASSRKKDEE